MTVQTPAANEMMKQLSERLVEALDAEMRASLARRPHPIFGYADDHDDADWSRIVD